MQRRSATLSWHRQLAVVVGSMWFPAADARTCQRQRLIAVGLALLLVVMRVELLPGGHP